MMKLLFIILILLLCIPYMLIGQETPILEPNELQPMGDEYYIKHAERTYEDNTGQYIIKFEYNIFSWSEPAECSKSRKRHYDAIITIFQKKNGDMKMVGKPFLGVYVESGCFEDESSSLLKKAKEIQHKIDTDSTFVYKEPHICIEDGEDDTLGFWTTRGWAVKIETDSISIPACWIFDNAMQPKKVIYGKDTVNAGMTTVEAIPMFLDMTKWWKEYKKECGKKRKPTMDGYIEFVEQKLKGKN